MDRSLIGLAVVEAYIVAMGLFVAWLSLRRDRKQEQTSSDSTPPCATHGYEFDLCVPDGSACAPMRPRMTVPKRYPLVRTRRTSRIA